MSSTDILPPTELSNIRAELLLPTTSILPRIVLPAEVSGGPADLHGGSIVVERQVAKNRRPAHGIARAARWQVLNLQIAADCRGGAEREGSAALDGQIAADRRAVKSEVAADHRDVAGDPPTVEEYTILTGGDGHAAVEVAVIDTVAGRA